MSSQKVAVVTGSNKGIGFAIVKGLCEKFGGLVYLTSRDVGRGQEAVAKLKSLGFNPAYHQLDITNQDSITKLKDHMIETHGGIDLLVNNAAIAFKVDVKDPFSVQAQTTVAVNYFSTLNVCEKLFPILKENGRVVNISSSCGHLSKIPSCEVREKFSDISLTVSGLNQLMEQFVKDANSGEHKKAGWGNSAYIVSKVGLSALTRIQQKEFDSEKPSRNISVNCVHPGYVNTDMSSHKGPLTIEEGARAPLFLCLEPHDLKGKYVWCDSKAAATEPFSEQAKTTVEINYFATLQVCQTLFPILRKDARVVNVSSSAGHLSRIPSADLQKKFSDPSLTIPQLNKLMEQFVSDAAEGKHEATGWGNSAYVVSKVGLSALTIIQQREFDKEEPNRNISVNSVHPGYVDTDMTSHKGILTVEEGAKAPLFLAVEPHNLKGKYVWLDSTVVDWYGESTPTKY